MFLFWDQHAFCFYNDSYGTILGRDRSEETMGGFGRDVLADTWETTGPQIERVFLTKKSELYKDLPIQVSHNGKDNLAYWNYSISPVIDDSGKTAGVLTMCIESNQGLRAYQQLQKNEILLKEALIQAKLAEQEAEIAVENANAARSSFLANMSHEIRTPLGAIMGFSRLALEKDASEQDRHKYLTVMTRNSNQVLGIIDDILDFAKIEAGTVVAESTEIAFAEFINNFATEMSLRAIEKGLTFIARADSTLPEKIVSDRERLKQILTNAVGNAIKFTSNGYVQLNVSFFNGQLSFLVNDTGQGISTEQARQLFRPFTQLDSSATRKFGGTGLGLVLSKKLCQLLGGDFILERSELGKGTTFKATVEVKVPVNTNILLQGHFFSKGASNQWTAEIRIQYQGTKVLIIEDCLDNQDLLKIMLDQHGVQFDLAENGRDGAVLALKNEYDMLLMDIQMPVMDGHQAARYLRSRNYNRPIIALSAHAKKAEIYLAEKSDFTEYLSKPITRESLVSTINKYQNH